MERRVTCTILVEAWQTWWTLAQVKAVTMNDKARGDYHEQWSHVEQQVLIRATRDFVVCIDNEGKIDWETTPEYDAKGPRDPGLHNSILNAAALLEETPSEGLPQDRILQFKRLICEAMACSLEHDYDNARKMLAAAEKYIHDRSEEMSRSWYLAASFVATLPFVVPGFVIWLLRSKAIIFLGNEGMWLVLASIAGAMGALLSVITRSGKLQLNSSAGRHLHYLEATSRIFAGALSAFLVSLAVKYEIIFGTFARGGKMEGVMLMVGFVAGAGERLATSIVSKLESPHGDVAVRKGQNKPGRASA